VSVGGGRLRFYAAPIAEIGGPAAGGAVLVASDTSDISRTIGHLGFVLVVAGLVVIAVTVAGAALLTRRGLRPLRRLAGAAADIERTADPAARLPASGVGDEIAQLSGVLNRMLASLEDARASERRFLADASHELRTPVTALLGNVEFVARHGAEPEVLSDLRRDAGRLARLVDDLLVLERAGAGADAGAAAGEAEAVWLDELVAGARGCGSARVGTRAFDRGGDRRAPRREGLCRRVVVHGGAAAGTLVAAPPGRDQASAGPARRPA
jgi:signal transduction histidine kinase